MNILVLLEGGRETRTSSLDHALEKLENGEAKSVRIEVTGKVNGWLQLDADGIWTLREP
jgi:hypothetical protein